MKAPGAIIDKSQLMNNNLKKQTDDEKEGLLVLEMLKMGKNKMGDTLDKGSPWKNIHNAISNG